MTSAASPIQSPFRQPGQDFPRKALKYVWRNFGVRQLVLENRLRKSRREWDQLKAICAPVAPSKSILIIPSDPYALTTSVGDQAMIGSIMAYWRKKRPGHAFYFATANADADRAATGLGAQPLRMMGKDMSMPHVHGVLKSHRFATAILMGADGLDGSYDPSFSGQQLMVLDLAARLGAAGYVTGFSVSKAFDAGVQRIFADLHPSIQINLRDPLSFERFRDQTNVPARQVADVAFLLPAQTTARMEPTLGWIAQQKASGHRVVAVNFHPLLLELSDRAQFPKLVDTFAMIHKDLAANENLSLLLLSHDQRGASSDALGLDPLFDALKSDLGARLCQPSEQLSAPEIKGLVKSLDAVVSGRMHLMIASIGAGTPVYGIDYKDKMEGLLMLLGLETTGLSTAADILENPDKVAAGIECFLDELPAEQAKIATRIDAIKALALQNFEEPTSA
ncbi:hypothetical protein C1J03_12065 [Sulfitobacter sp. SK012]|uniref:polysaccharide pyruvyl transferase family protein n=1 Tax=Sulfitobacter sp. SK012 TaxID=1389005 RepID=UPI000E0AEE79|nr:polysaccharide pyruvyl transferase family protein [Sulfitobacter sp. SK012]AXI46693.1 hypothetical protein C1J03_12065 [Sulfitobacter sp. SK012]